MSGPTIEPDGDRKKRRPRAGTGRVKLDEVAKLAGVSTATVSRAFNEPKKVSEAVRARVFKAAERLNWIPNAAGRALASSRTQMVGTITPSIDNETFARQIAAQQAVFSEAGLTLVVGCSDYDPATSLAQVQTMLSRGVEALAIVGQSHPRELYEALERSRVPFVFTYSYRVESTYPCIGFDNEAAFDLITSHLLDFGHRNFAGFFQPDRDNDRVNARIAGFKKALRLAGCPVPEHQVTTGPSTIASGMERFTKLIDTFGIERPTAIVCGNDTLALGALIAAKERGMEIPRDLSVTGFDDLEIASKMTPALTTMAVDSAAIGQASARQLLQAIRQPSFAPPSIEFFAELKRRQSTGPVPPTSR